jgi:hypothetical protein
MLRRVPDLADARAAREARIDYKTALHFFATGMDRRPGAPAPWPQHSIRATRRRGWRWSCPTCRRPEAALSVARRHLGPAPEGVR